MPAFAYMVRSNPKYRVLKFNRSKMRAIYMQLWKQCTLSVITRKALGQPITVHHVPMSCHKAITVISGRVHCSHDCIYNIYIYTQKFSKKVKRLWCCNILLYIYIYWSMSCNRTKEFMSSLSFTTQRHILYNYLLYFRKNDEENRIHGYF